MIYFVTATDTGVGKTVATGLLARSYATSGKKVITAKLVQTGCSGISEDIVCHRQIMGIDLLPEDISGGTCGYVFELAASPHLAAEKAGESIDVKFLEKLVNDLAREYEIVLLEGAGGLMVPLTRKYLTVDLVAANHWPLIIVTGPWLGSINHTLLTIDTALNRGCEIAGVMYNTGLREDRDKVIETDSRAFFVNYLEERGIFCFIGDLGRVTDIGKIGDNVLSVDI